MEALDVANIMNACLLDEVDIAFLVLSPLNLLLAGFFSIMVDIFLISLLKSSVHAPEEVFYLLVNSILEVEEDYLFAGSA